MEKNHDNGAAAYRSEHPNNDRVWLRGWVARDKNGDIALFTHEPERHGSVWLSVEGSVWPLPKSTFRQVKWTGEPLEANLMVRPWLSRTPAQTQT